MVGHHYWPDAAALTTPTVTIANVRAIGRTMKDDESNSSTRLAGVKSRTEKEAE
jgi:hypothetical protein